MLSFSHYHRQLSLHSATKRDSRDVSEGNMSTADKHWDKQFNNWTTTINTSNVKLEQRQNLTQLQQTVRRDVIEADIHQRITDVQMSPIDTGRPTDQPKIRWFNTTTIKQKWLVVWNNVSIVFLAAR